MSRHSRSRTAASRWILVTLVVLLVFSVAACGGGEQAPADDEGSAVDNGDSAASDQEQTDPADEEPPAEQDEGDEGESEDSEGDESDDEVGDLDVENVFAGTDLQDLLAYFAVLDYDWTARGNVEGTEQGATFGVRYELEGSETVDGTETEKLLVDMRGPNATDETFTFWLDENGEAVQMQSGETMMPAEQAQMMTQSMLMMAFLPFQMMSSFDYQAALQEDEIWQVTDHSQEQATVAGHDVTLHTLSVDQSAGEGGTYEWQYADFGDFQMFVDWSASIEGTEQGFELTINELQAR